MIRHFSVAYFRDRAIGLCSFIGDLVLGAFIFAFLIGQTSHSYGNFFVQFFTEILAGVETLGSELRMSALIVHLFFIYTLTLILRAFFILSLGRSPGDMAVGRVPFINLRERGKHAGLNFLMVLVPPACLLPDHRRRPSLSWSVIVLLGLTGLLWPWPMLWRLSHSSSLSRNESLPISELKLDVAQGDFSQSVVFESRVFGFEALSENPENLITFPCPQNTKGAWVSGAADVCFYEVATKEWMILSMPGLFSLQAPLARYLEFSGIFSTFFSNDASHEASNLARLIEQAMELGPYDGIKGVLAHGPFLQGLLHFKLFLLQLMETKSGPALASLVKIGERNFFQVKSENKEDWSVSFFPLATHPTPMLKLSGPVRSGDLRERFAKTFLSSIKWSTARESESDRDGLGGLCDFVFEENVVNAATDSQSLLHKEDALVKLYASVATVAMREKSVALRRILLRALQQFKRSKRSKLSERLDKILGGIFVSLSNNDPKGFEVDAGGSGWK